MENRIEPTLDDVLNTYVEENELADRRECLRNGLGVTPNSGKI